MPFSLFKRKLPRKEAGHAYGTIVDQARQPFFYLECGVPDSVDGRFDLVVLHAFVLMHRTTGQGEAAERFNQTLFDLMFADMDANLRTMGVSDLRVGKKVKEMARAFYGRSVAYRDALALQDDEALISALKRNLYRQSDPQEGELLRVAGYIRAQAEELARQPVEAILAGKVRFLPPDAGGEQRS